MSKYYNVTSLQHEPLCAISSPSSYQDGWTDTPNIVCIFIILCSKFKYSWPLTCGQPWILAKNTIKFIVARQTMYPTGRKLEDTTSGLHFTFKPLRYYFPTAFKFFVYYFCPIRDDLRIFYGKRRKGRRRRRRRRRRLRSAVP